MSEYQQLTAQFGVVRNSWKRMMALSGMAIVVSEGIAILTVLLVLDWLFKPMPLVRIVLWALALGAIAWFFIRHVLTPLMRKIPDEQIALYIEEHRSELDGVLITAAEYAENKEREPGRAALIAAVIKEASVRGTRTAMSRVVDLSRLKKYGVITLAGICLYVLASLLFPDAVGHRLGRILEPWHPTAEDKAKVSPTTFLLQPLKIVLSRGNTNFPRGSTFDLEATLSRPVDKPVVLNFHAINGGEEWQKLPFAEIEKLNGFKVALPDVSEDLEFYVSCGNDKSETYKISVYDPLVIQSLEVTTHYPDYTKLPDRVEPQSSGDVEALIGSKVTVKILTNAPLKDGHLKLGTGQTLNLVVDPADKTAASATFEVTENTSYDYALSDVNDQEASNPAPYSVRAVVDKPPTITVNAPQPYVLTNPLGEVHFDVNATDDFGVASVDLVYLRVGEDGKSTEVRVPLKLESENPKDASDRTALHGTATLMLEDAKPLFKPEDVISYNLEARDTKGQKTVSELGLITIGYFETWATWEMVKPEPAGGASAEGPDLLAMLKAVWLLDSEKPTLAPTDFQKQCKQMADLMTDKASGNVCNFVDLEKYPQLAPVAGKIQLHAKNARDALVAAQSDVASTELRIAAAIYTGGKLMDDLQEHKKDQMKDTSNGSLHTAEPPTVTLLELARLDAVKKGSADQAHTEKEAENAKSSAATSQAIDDLLKKQADLVAKAKSQQAEAKPKSDGSAPSKASTSLAATQKEIAEKTKAAADAAKNNPAASKGSKLQQAADKAAEASQTMFDAARDFAAGKNAEAQAKAIKAQKELQEARDSVVNTDRDQLEAAISKLESRTSALLDSQRDIRTNTETVGKDLPAGKTPDQRQKRDIEELAVKQASLRGESDAIVAELDNLTKWAEQVGKPEVVHSLGEAQSAVKHDQPSKKMANAIVELNNTSPSTAVDEQKKAEAALAKILSDLNDSSEALADTRDEKVRSAARAAAEAMAAAKSLAAGEAPGEAPGQAPGEAPGQAPGKAPGEAPGKAAGKAPGEAPGKAAGKAPGEAPGQAPGKAPGEAPGKAAGKAPGEAPGKAAGKAPDEAPGKAAGKAPGEAPAQGQSKLSEADRKAAAQTLAYQANHLVMGLTQRDIVNQNDIDLLKKEMTMDKDELEKRLLVDPKLLQDVTVALSHISEKLEAEMEAKTEAKKLFSSQREECPPAYRQFVNKYFEVLSQVSRPTEAGENH